LPPGSLTKTVYDKIKDDGSQTLTDVEKILGVKEWS